MSLDCKLKYESCNLRLLLLQSLDHLLRLLLLILILELKQILFHILLVQGTIVFVAAINTEVILSFLGLGIQDGVSWGLMLAESSQEVLAGHFGNFIAAGSSLFLLLMGFTLLADALQDALDTRGEFT